MTDVVMNCKNCNSEVAQNFCPNCGRAANAARIDGLYILSEIGKVFQLEKGIFYTIRELIMRPGRSIRDFLAGDRDKLIKPLTFVIITSVIYSLFNRLTRFEDMYIADMGLEQTEAVTVSVMRFIQGNYEYANILAGFFIAFWNKLLFRKYQFNFFEILILCCYVVGMFMLIYFVFAVLQVVMKFNFIEIATVIGTFYSTWAMGQFFDGKRIVNYVKAFFAYILGFISFIVVASIIGVIVFILFKP
ncbi:MAG: hypothetical protein OHK0057_22570 [Thermoflexibacter sp.]